MLLSILGYWKKMEEMEMEWNERGAKCGNKDDETKGAEAFVGPDLARFGLHAGRAGQCDWKFSPRTCGSWVQPTAAMPLLLLRRPLTVWPITSALMFAGVSVPIYISYPFWLHQLGSSADDGECQFVTSLAPFRLSGEHMV